MNGDRWEHGSDQHWIDATGSATYPWGRDRTLFGSGRHANEAALRSSGCARLWVPSFYCQEVAAAFPRDVVQLVTYPDRPGCFAMSLESLPVRATDAVLVVNTLGLRARPPAIPDGVSVIEDHTHDLLSEWAFASRADYCVASLRKVLPVPDGGVVWSPRQRPLPAMVPPHSAHLGAAFARFTAMVLKASYLLGGTVDKAAFRAQAVAGEASIAEGPLSGIAPFTEHALPAFPVTQWRDTRNANFAALRAALADCSQLDVLAPEPAATPYAVTVRFDTAARRESVRSALIAARIYPAVLWSLEQPAVEITEEDRDLSRRILSIHCDHRYTIDDMQRVARMLREALA